MFQDILEVFMEGRDNHRGGSYWNVGIFSEISTIDRLLPPNPLPLLGKKTLWPLLSIIQSW